MFTTLLEHFIGVMPSGWEFLPYVTSIFIFMFLFDGVLRGVTYPFRLFMRTER